MKFIYKTSNYKLIDSVYNKKLCNYKFKTFHDFIEMNLK